MTILDMLLIAAAVALALGLAALFKLLHARNMHIWIVPYILRRRPKSRDTRHIMFCFVDHYEPQWGGAGYETECARVDRWVAEYPALAEGHRDADGVPPRHTFFYPEEEYRPEHLDKLTGLCRDGLGEIEIHLHHDNDTEAGLREKLGRFVRQLTERHDALPLDPETGRPAWAFIHGNWCLDNSRRDGRWCGVNNELIVLADEGCYADFTLPSAPSDTQTAKINSIYYATDDPERPKSHNSGVDVRTGSPGTGDLMIIQGPLGLNWRDRKWGVMPRIENADIRSAYPPSPERVDRWVEEAVHVRGRPEWIFIKIHTHGTQDNDMDTLLGPPVERMFAYLEERYNDGEDHVLHYVSAREMYNIVKAAEMGEQGNPGRYRDYLIPRPAYTPVAEAD